MRRAAAVALLLSSLATTACVHPPTPRPVLDARGQKEMAALRQRVRIYEDPALVDYLGTLVPPFSPPIVIVRDPTLALFSTPTGEVVVHTGVLAAARSEGQLAAVLNHELQHVARDDTFEAGEPEALGQRLRPATASRTAVAIAGQNLPLTARAAISGYGAARERAADAASLDALASAGRDPGEAVAMYEALAAQAARGGEREVFYFGNASRLAERLASVRALLTSRATAERSAAPAPAAQPEEFMRRLRPVVLENAYEEIRQGRFDLARRQLERVAATAPDDARLPLYQGELYRLEAQRAGTAAEREVELVQARAAYERALALDPTLAEAHRQLGLLYYAMRDVARARSELEHYLVLAPSAPDRDRVREYVMELAR